MTTAVKVTGDSNGLQKTLCDVGMQLQGSTLTFSTTCPVGQVL